MFVHVSKYLPNVILLRNANRNTQRAKLLAQRRGTIMQNHIFRLHVHLSNAAAFSSYSIYIYIYVMERFKTSILLSRPACFKAI